MVWIEEVAERDFVVSDDVVDLAYSIDCRSVPLEHGHTLSEAILEVLPWLADETSASIHQIHGAESGNGWLRPENTENEVLYLSRRTRMVIRVPKHRIEDARQLSGAELDVDGHSLTVGDASIRKLVALSTVFSRYVVCDETQTEADFEKEIINNLLQSAEVRVRKMLCGRTHTISLPDRKLFTRSIMLADLAPDEAVRLQQQGLGEYQKLGCGIFLPHKGIPDLSAED